MAESEEELKKLLIKMKEESEKADLKYPTLITNFSCLSWMVRGPIGKKKNWEITRA